VLKLHTGDIEERRRQSRESIPDIDNYDVAITTYEMVKVVTVPVAPRFSSASPR
jgi:hypothetical protein